MKQSSSRFSLAQRLFAISSALILLLVALAITVWVMMAKVTDAAARVNLTNVPQLQLISEIELNVTRASLQLRHAILARNPAELNSALADIAENRDLLSSRLEQFGKGMVDDEGRKAFAPLPGLMQEFWRLGVENIKLIEAGKKDDAFAFLVDKTIPARNQLLAPLGVEKKRQGERLEFRIKEVNDLADLDRNVVIFAVALVALGLIGLSFYLQNMTRQLGADPAELKDVADAVASGNLAASIKLRNGDTESIMASLSMMSSKLAATVQTVRFSAEGVSTASAEIAQGNNDLSDRTEQQASALEQTAASMEELNSTVRQNADNARQANQLAMSASTVAVHGGEVVSQVVETMKGINDSSKKIADIIGVIDGIAFQTNILALNAAVEAARAGEQGRGFAVVATEVRNLAGRSAEAAKEIKALIGDSVQRVEQGSVLVDQAGTTMTEVVGAIRRVTDLMGEISAASTEQSQGVAQVGNAVTQMDEVTQQNAALVEEMAAAAGSLRTQAQDMVETVAFFKLSDDHGSVARVASAPMRRPSAQLPKSNPARLPSKPAAKNLSRPAANKSLAPPAASSQARASSSGADGDWESF
jgi:methyl-accepting chemotaxis protein